MQKFLNSIIAFLLLAAISFALFFWVTAKLVTSDDSRYLIEDDITTLILGHSHAACSLNDELLAHTKNLASGAEAYLFTYVKLRKLLEVNPQISRVFIEFSNNQISYRMNHWTWGEPEMLWNYSKYAHVTPLSEQLVIATRNPSGFFKGFNAGLKENVKYFLRDNDLVDSGAWGGYEKLDNEYKAEINAIEKTYDDRPRITSSINLLYLQKCISFCQKQGVDVALVRSPIHANYSFLKNEEVFQNIRMKLFSGIPFHDFKSFQLESTDLSDTEHLNYKGAIKFSKHFNTTVLSK